MWQGCLGGKFGQVHIYIYPKFQSVRVINMNLVELNADNLGLAYSNIRGQAENY